MDGSVFWVPSEIVFSKPQLTGEKESKISERIKLNLIKHIFVFYELVFTFKMLSCVLVTKNIISVCVNSKL